jgi:hypothetical protein
MKSIINQQPLKQKCENIGRRSLLSYAFSSLLLLVQSDTNLWYAYRGWLVGLSNSIRVAHREVTTNNRLFVGLVFMFGLAPLAWLVPYLNIFSVDDPLIPGYYYGNIAAYIFTIQFKVVLILACTGFFIAAPIKWNYKYACVVIVALAFSSLINETFFIGEYRDFYNIPTVLTILTVFVVVWSAMKFIDYAVHRKYHTKDGNTARIIGVIEMDVPITEKENTLKLLAKEYRDFNNRV